MEDVLAGGEAGGFDLGQGRCQMSRSSEANCYSVCFPVDTSVCSARRLKDTHAC